ncbi:MAG TPA: hypothetical protein VGT06_00505 [Candidatus Methylomirabilis sp.]|nr:hypothetical protein [Candidatus Methylomirabilis sp.]
MPRAPSTNGVSARPVDARRAVAIALVALILALVAPPLSHGHTILEPEVVQGLLLDISRFHKESREGTRQEARLEALYELGQRVHGLVQLMNKDIGAHGFSDLFARLIVRRLHEYGIQVHFVEGMNQYAYDLAAFREYLERAPKGNRAADVRYRLIADAFYRTLSPDSPGMFNGNLEGLVRAVAEEEEFLKDFPDDKRAKEVHLFRATDYYRLFRNSRDRVEAGRYEGLALEALRKVVAQYRGSPEARAAEGLLERLKEDKETSPQAR